MKLIKFNFEVHRRTKKSQQVEDDKDEEKQEEKERDKVLVAGDRNVTTAGSKLDILPDENGLFLTDYFHLWSRDGCEDV